MVPQGGIEPPLALYIRQPRCHCATGASIRSFRDSAELLPTSHVAQFIPTRLAQADLALLFVAELFTASFTLKTWSGRRDSNPRRPAWEDDRKLQTKNIAFSACRSGDTEYPVFTLCLPQASNGAQMEHKVYQDDHAKKAAGPLPSGFAAICILSGENFNGTHCRHVRVVSQ